MQFLIHGAVQPEATAALVRHEHVCHTPAELTGDAAEIAAAGPQAFLELLTARQWQLVTTDAALVRAVYEQKLAFSGIIVMMLDDPEKPGGQGGAVDRLFERYHRLMPGRLYTITPSLVKIRQLPGGHSQS